MKLSVSIILGFISFSVLANTALPNNRHISVQGTATVKAVPDIAKVRFEVKSIKDSSLDAKKDVDERINKLLQGLSEYQIEEDAVTASSLLTEPYITYKEDDTEEVSGYIATRTVKVTLNGLDKLSDFINFALSLEINEIENIELQSSNSKELKDRANQLAVENAKSIGRSLAKAFEAELGRIYSINSTYHQSNYGYRSKVEAISVTASRVDTESVASGRYLQASINYDASIDVVFDLEVK